MYNNYRVGNLLASSGKRRMLDDPLSSFLIIEIDCLREKYMILEEDEIVEWDWGAAEDSLMKMT